MRQRLALLLPSAIAVSAITVTIASCGTSDRATFSFADDAAVVEENVTQFAEGGEASGSNDPDTCENAAAARAYVGCDFWPTVVANPVWSIFDFAVVVANTSASPAEVEVTGNGVSKRVTVAAGGLQKVFLPWQKQLKGKDFDHCGDKARGARESMQVPKGAYHVVASRPVTVYQFNALEYKGAGGDSSKSWAG